MKQYQAIVPFFDATLDLREFSALPRGELAAMAYRLGELHHKIHRTAAHLSELSSTGRQIQNSDFDAFAQARINFRNKLIVLRDRLAGAWSFLDPLTGILRREAMQVILYQEQSRVERGKYQCSIAMVDIDHFKQVNDCYGHQVGDQVLQMVAQTLLDHSRAMDTVFRYGGEEILICLPGTTSNDAMQILDRLRADIESRCISIEQQEPLSITISIGITTLQPASSIEKSITQADQALYQAKRDGRNRTIVFSPSNTG